MLPDRVRSWIEQAAGGRVISATLMLGASSSLLHSIVVESAGEPRSLVLRRFTNEEWVRHEPDIAFREASSVQKAFGSGLPAPELVACDPDGSLCGSPATLVTLLPGEVVLEPVNRSRWVEGLAHTAALIHRIDARDLPWKYRRFNERETLQVPQWSRAPKAWNKVIECVQASPPPYHECFVHRDYHPSNVLWHGDDVSGVVDWVNGCRGPAGIDVAWCRHNLANLHGVEAADEFLAAYVAVAGSAFQYDPYWDFMSVVELLPGPPAMYDGWRASGFPEIHDALMRERVDRYVASVVARL